MEQKLAQSFRETVLKISQEKQKQMADFSLSLNIGVMKNPNRGNERDLRHLYGFLRLSAFCRGWLCSSSRSLFFPLVRPFSGLSFPAYNCIIRPSNFVFFFSHRSVDRERRKIGEEEEEEEKKRGKGGGRGTLRSPLRRFYFMPEEETARLLLLLQLILLLFF